MGKKIGQTELVSFPDIGIKKIKAKIDTGAFSTSIHVNGIKVEDGILKFWINDPKDTFEFKKFEKIMVKNSFGEKQERYLIMTKIRIGNITYKIHTSLSNRSEMKHQVLIGRRFLLENKFIVDVTKKNLNA